MSRQRTHRELKTAGIIRFARARWRRTRSNNRHCWPPVSQHGWQRDSHQRGSCLSQWLIRRPHAGPPCPATRTTGHASYLYAHQSPSVGAHQATWASARGRAWLGPLCKPPEQRLGDSSGLAGPARLARHQSSAERSTRVMVLIVLHCYRSPLPFMHRTQSTCGYGLRCGFRGQVTRVKVNSKPVATL